MASLIHRARHNNYKEDSRLHFEQLGLVFPSYSKSHTAWGRKWCSLLKLLHEEQLYLQEGLISDDICQRLNLNRTTLSLLIQRFGRGHNLRSLINGFRVLHAMRLLESRCHTIGEVSLLSGFRSRISFIRAFKQMVGVTPKAFYYAPFSPPPFNLSIAL